MNKNCFDLQQPLITNLIDFDLFMIEKKIKRIYLKFLSVLSLLYHLFDSAQRSMKEITDFRLLLFSKKKKKNIQFIILSLAKKKKNQRNLTVRFYSLRVINWKILFSSLLFFCSWWIDSMLFSGIGFWEKSNFFEIPKNITWFIFFWTWSNFFFKNQLEKEFWVEKKKKIELYFVFWYFYSFLFIW